MDCASRMESLVKMTRHWDFELNPYLFHQDTPMFYCKGIKIRYCILFAFAKHWKFLRQYHCFTIGVHLHQGVPFIKESTFIKESFAFGFYSRALVKKKKKKPVERF